MVQALSVAPEALQNYTASPAVGLYLPPKNPHHNPPAFPFVFRAFTLTPKIDCADHKDRPAFSVLSFITRQRIEAISGRSQHPVSHSDGKIAAAISLFQYLNLWDTATVQSVALVITVGIRLPDNSSGHWNDCRISADFVNKDTFKSAAGRVARDLLDGVTHRENSRGAFALLKHLCPPPPSHTILTIRNLLVHAK